MMQLGLGLDASAADDVSLHRVFFALWPDDGLRADIERTAATLERDHAPGGRRLKPERDHLTLQFLRDFQPLPPSLIDTARAAADAVRAPAFAMPLDCAGSFRGSNVWWLGAQAMPAGLQTLWERLGAALLRARVPVKASASFVPHLTIQRDVRRQLPQTPIAPLSWHVDRFVLIDSQPGRPYDVVGSWPLSG